MVRHFDEFYMVVFLGFLGLFHFGSVARQRQNGYLHQVEEDRRVKRALIELSAL